MLAFLGEKAALSLPAPMNTIRVWDGQTREGKVAIGLAPPRGRFRRLACRRMGSHSSSWKEETLRLVGRYWRKEKKIRRTKWEKGEEPTHMKKGKSKPNTEKVERAGRKTFFEPGS